MNKETILQNITKQNFISRKFLKINNITEQECYNICHSSGNCKYCYEEAEYINWGKGYKEICSSKLCKQKLRSVKTKKTNLERYGVENAFQIPELQKQIRESTKKTNLERYGVENTFQSKELNYTNGVQNAHSLKANAKRDETMLQRYGTTDPLEINDGRTRGIAKCNSEEINIKRKGRKCSIELKELLNECKAKHISYKSID